MQSFHDPKVTNANIILEREGRLCMHIPNKIWHELDLVRLSLTTHAPFVGVGFQFHTKLMQTQFNHNIQFNWRTRLSNFNKN